MKPRPVYNFLSQLRWGQRHEGHLDALFAATYQIQPATPQQQHHGIDRIFTRNGQNWAVEYKSDACAERTHRAFLETVSVTHGTQVRRRGWLHASHADILVYYVPADHIAHIYPFPALRALVARLDSQTLGALKTVRNNGYLSQGYAVPFAVLRPACLQTKYVPVPSRRTHGPLS